VVFAKAEGEEADLSCARLSAKRAIDKLIPNRIELKGDAMPEFVKVARTDDIPAGQARMVEVNGQEIALFNVGGSFHAIDNTCTHVGGPLCEGEVEGIEVTCPWHGAVFDVTTGQVLGPPAGQGVSRYNVRVDGSDIEVEV
jgi:nitrite reductase/ring-hydroxylating ferredoxin subunit